VKKALLMVMILLVIMMVGCKEKTEVVIDSMERAYLEMAFDERTKEVKEYMQKKYEWSITPNWYKDSSQQNLIRNASLEKKDNYYILKLDFVIPKIYDKDAIENAYNQAKENDIYSFDGYTFYKDDRLPIENIDIDYYQEGEILTTKSEDMDSYYIFKPIQNEPYYYVLWSDIYSTRIVFEHDKELEVVLLPNDKISITFDRDLNTNIGKELTVEEYYQKAIKNDVSSADSIYGFEYKLDSIGNDILPWNDTNAVNFENESVNVNFHIGGI